MYNSVKKIIHLTYKSRRKEFTNQSSAFISWFYSILFKRIKTIG